MSAILRHHSLDCAAARRHRNRRPRTHVEGGTLNIAAPELAARLIAEGVPPADVRTVAVELERCIRIIANEGDDVLYMRVHRSTAELIRRYGDKLGTLTMTTRGKVTR